jgi:predicted GNAT superfamily acetyltransferase
LAFTIRELTSHDDCRAAVVLQREIWGFDIGDIVPAPLFHVVSLVGGLAAGAFDAEGRMLGFLFGVTGIRGGVLSHWSHMLGVREHARNAGVGRMLKEFQRATLGKLGIVRIYWTFDPLQAKNAYFNLHRLGAQIDEYVPDMYGDTGSPLHLGLPTDRLIVHIRAAGRDYAPAPFESYKAIPILTGFPQAGDLLLSEKITRPPAVLIEMPSNINEVTRRSIDDARVWRQSVRGHFEKMLERGYVVNAVHRDAETGRAFYVSVPRAAT